MDARYDLGADERGRRALDRKRKDSLLHLKSSEFFLFLWTAGSFSENQRLTYMHKKRTGIQPSGFHLLGFSCC